MTQPDDRALSDELLQRAGIGPLGEAAIAIAEICEELQGQGFTRGEALYWSAVYLAKIMHNEDHTPFEGDEPT